MNVKIFDINNKLAYQYFDVSVGIDYREGKIDIYSNGAASEYAFSYAFHYKTIQISQDEKEIIIYARGVF